MSDARKEIPRADRERVAKRVAELEQHTDAEVVCAIATESGRYDRAESACGILVGLVMLISGNKIAAMGDWGATAGASLGAQVGLVVTGFVVGSWLASYWHGLRRLFVFKAEQDAEVRRSVHQVFSQQGIGKTSNRGGLLLYLSLFERRLEVHGDSTIGKRISAEDLESIRDAVLLGVRQGRIADGLIAGLDCAEATLARVFPPTTCPRETLTNSVLLFHPRP